MEQFVILYSVDLLPLPFSQDFRVFLDLSIKFLLILGEIHIDLTLKDDKEFVTDVTDKENS